MATPNKPPGEDPLSRLLADVGKQIESRLKDWVAKNSGGKTTGNVAGKPKTEMTDTRPGSSQQPTGQGVRAADPAKTITPQPTSIAMPKYDGGEIPEKHFDSGKLIFRLVFFVLPALGVGKFLWSGKWKSNTDFKEFNNINDVFSSVINGFLGEITMSGLFSSLVLPAIFIVGIIFVIKAIRVVPQQRALVVERLGRFDRVLEPGLRFTIPFVDRISAKHDLREVPLDVPPQVCITRDNTQLQVDGILYFQVTDPKLATYGSSNFMLAITQLAQTTLRSIVGKLELDKTFEERDMINHAVVSALDLAAGNWGVKVLRYEIKDLTPPKEILHAMQAQITAEREKRALIAASEGRKQEQINIAMGQKEAAIAKSEGNKISDINQAQGEAAAILAKADANAEAIRKIAMAIESQGGLQAVNLKVAEQYIAALGNIAKTGNTIVVPQNLTDIASLVTTATSVLKSQKAIA